MEEYPEKPVWQEPWRQAPLWRTVCFPAYKPVSGRLRSTGGLYRRHSTHYQESED